MAANFAAHTFVQVAGVSGAAAVALGTYGAFAFGAPRPPSARRPAAGTVLTATAGPGARAPRAVQRTRLPRLQTRRPALPPGAKATPTRRSVVHHRADLARPHMHARGLRPPGGGGTLGQTFDTASRYHLFHSAVLLTAPLWRRPLLVREQPTHGVPRARRVTRSSQTSAPAVVRVFLGLQTGPLFVAGIVLFSGRFGWRERRSASGHAPAH